MDAKSSNIRWGNNKRLDADFAREKILNAALCCYLKNTFKNTRMEHIAREANVSRTTIYRHFQNRDEVVLGVIVRELSGVIDMIREQVAKETSFAEFVVETLAVADERIRESPAFALIVRESMILMERIQTYSSEMVSIGRIYFRARFDVASAAGELRKGIEFEEFIDWVSHIGASFIMLSPVRSDSKGFRPKLWRYLIPSIVSESAIPAERCG